MKTKTIVFLVVILLGIFQVQAACSGGECKRSEEMNMPFYFGELCTQLGFTITNPLMENCTSDVTFSVDNIPITCENSPTVSLDKNESLWVVCISQQFKEFCEGIHSARVSFCKNTISFSYGKLSAKILMPIKNSSVQGDEIIFSGEGDEGIYKNSTYEYEWTSSIDGVLSKEKDFTTKGLSAGKHEITLKISKTGEDQQVAQNKIFIEILKKKEQVEQVEYSDDKFFCIIFLPVPRTYIEGEKINFMGFSAQGAEPYSYEWHSDIDGFLSYEESFSTRALSSGKHDITLTVADANGQTTKQTLSINIEKSQLIVSILSPTKSRIYKTDEQIPLEYKIAGGKKPYTVLWYVDGIQTDNLTTLQKGEHEITLSVSDSVGNSLTDSVKILASDECNFNSVCEHGENFANCPQDCPSGGIDDHCDGSKDGICDMDCERALDEDCYCNYDGVCEINFENFANCPQDCSSGGKDNYCNAVKDNVCDPDCLHNEDSDCRQDYSNYVLLFVLVIIIIFAAFRLRNIIAR